MEIKQGDKVRVSKDAPRMYLRGWAQAFQIREAEVITIEDDNAVIETFELSLAIPTKYLIKVDAEAKEPAAPTIKVGDMVIVKQDVDMSKTFSIFKREVSIVKRIDNDEVTLEINSMGHGVLELTDVPLECIEKVDVIEYLHGNGADGDGENDTDSLVAGIDKVIEGHCKTLADIAASFDWQRYEADLAKEIALKVTNKKMDNHPEEIGVYAVRVAKAVVENLKNKQI